MQLEEMRANRKIDEEDPALEASLVQAKEKFDGLLAAVDEDLRVEWEQWDEGGAAARAAAQRKWWPCSTAALPEQSGPRRE